MQDAFLKSYAHLKDFQEDSRFLHLAGAHRGERSADAAAQNARPNQFSLDEPIEGEEDLMPRELEDWGPSPEQRFCPNGNARNPVTGHRQAGAGFSALFSYCATSRNFSTEETANALGISIPAVKSRLLRASSQTPGEAESLFSGKVAQN